MVFPNNIVKLSYDGGVTIVFNAFDALKMVDPHKETLSVAASKEWLERRYVVNRHMRLSQHHVVDMCLMFCVYMLISGRKDSRKLRTR